MTSQTEALAWATQFEPFDRWEAVSTAPWSRVYRLSGKRRATFLKISPCGKGSEIAVLEAFSGSTLRSIPKVVAHDCGLGLLLMEDHGGAPKKRAGFKELNKVIQAYADLQSASIALQPRMASLPRVQSQMMAGLADALYGKQGQSLIKGFLSRGEARSVAIALAASEKEIRFTLADGGGLPLLLEHGDLHPGNLAFRPDGSIVIFDWADALWAPAGFSIPFLLGGATAATEQLRRRGPSPCRTYLSALVERGYATRSELDHCLQASMVGGVLRALLEFTVLKAIDESTKPFIGHQVRVALNDLITVVHS